MTGRTTGLFSTKISNPTKNVLNKQLSDTEMEQHLKITKKKKKIQKLKGQIDDLTSELEQEKSKSSMLFNLLNDLKLGHTTVGDIDILLEGFSLNNEISPVVTPTRAPNDDFATQELISKLLNEEVNTQKEELESEAFIRRLIEEDKKKLQEELDKKKISVPNLR